MGCQVLMSFMLRDKEVGTSRKGNCEALSN